VPAIPRSKCFLHYNEGRKQCQFSSCQSGVSGPVSYADPPARPACEGATPAQSHQHQWHLSDNLQTPALLPLGWPTRWGPTGRGLRAGHPPCSQGRLCQAAYWCGQTDRHPAAGRQPAHTARPQQRQHARPHAEVTLHSRSPRQQLPRRSQLAFCSASVSEVFPVFQIKMYMMCCPRKREENKY